MSCDVTWAGGEDNERVRDDISEDSGQRDPGIAGEKPRLAHMGSGSRTDG